MPRAIPITIFFCLTLCQVFGQNAPAFEAATIKPSKLTRGQDGSITNDPGRLIARNATLKRLIFEAWQIPFAQISGGPAWINTDEYDVDAKSESPASLPQLRIMLRRLLTDRFKLSVSVELKESRIYALVVARGGAKLDASRQTDGSNIRRFHGDLSEFANTLAIQLTIPMSISDNPAIPSQAAGAPIPVVDKTGIVGIQDITLDIRPDQGGDTFTIWQRALREQLGLRLDARKAPVSFLAIRHAEKVPAK
jgi:uncharacterized protein (TIGR03435 family)